MSKPGPGDPVARDQDATAFSKHLEALLHQLPEVICAVFVDGEGETVDLASRVDPFEARIVDLASRVDPFEARIAGAEMSIVLHGLRIVRDKLGEGALIELRIEGNTRSILVRHVSVGYDLVVLIGAAAISARAAEITAAMAVTLLNEAGLKPPPTYAVMRTVEQRPSRLGFMVPNAFDENGTRRRVEAILGHRDEGDGAIRFLVRLEGGEELIVVHDRATARWVRS